MPPLVPNQRNSWNYPRLSFPPTIWIIWVVKMINPQKWTDFEWFEVSKITSIDICRRTSFQGKCPQVAAAREWLAQIRYLNFFPDMVEKWETINHENWGHMGSLACESCGMLRISPGKFGGFNSQCDWMFYRQRGIDMHRLTGIILAESGKPCPQANVGIMLPVHG